MFCGGLLTLSMHTQWSVFVTGVQLLQGNPNVGLMRGRRRE